ncbi:MAG: hypothetical protein H6621_11630 [Halobacteriovoraceae bacterium]|nr:hypothetical protein [Halobacteriovoraceae bacterium]MCB9095710.1 hypothetical protein [Halobacteriovoraceae bacterium]
MEVKRTGLEQKFFELCYPVVAELNYTLYDMDYLNGQKLLRLFIMDDKTQTAVIEDCVKVDRELTPFFENNEWIPEDIVLEVSSPGLYRKLRTLQHFEWSIGERIAVKYRGELELTEELKKEKALKNKVLVGEVKEIQPQGDGNFEIIFDVELKNNNAVININSQQIVSAHWEPQL